MLRQEQKLIEDSIKASIEQAKMEGIYIEEEEKKGSEQVQEKKEQIT